MGPGDFGSFGFTGISGEIGAVGFTSGLGSFDSESSHPNSGLHSGDE
ncbi:hypothetical protein BLSMQ_0082 [Brevibacterium aurantiacum]|uniref:Uncharacterized protein n=1 Tax=Brevibacterium aurantiacum TaxID=273384 RepID=A0A1D7VYM3_BREAU|nr:hypothetical protein BLSMQ_0082 [Brevibacterium aurantiacum]